MFIKRTDKNDAIVSGMVVNDMREKTYEDRTFYEIPVSMGKDAGILSVTVWNRKPEEIKKFDHVFCCGQFKKVTRTSEDGEEKTYYSLDADFVIKETSSKIAKDQSQELVIVDDGDLPF